MKGGGGGNPRAKLATTPAGLGLGPLLPGRLGAVEVSARFLASASARMCGRPVRFLASVSSLSTRSFTLEFRLLKVKSLKMFNSEKSSSNNIFYPNAQYFENK